MQAMEANVDTIVNNVESSGDDQSEDFSEQSENVNLDVLVGAVSDDEEVNSSLQTLSGSDSTEPDQVRPMKSVRPQPIAKSKPKLKQLYSTSWSPYLEPQIPYIVNTNRAHGIKLEKLKKRQNKKENSNNSESDQPAQFPELKPQIEEIIIVQRTRNGITLMTLDEAEELEAKRKGRMRREKLAAKSEARQGMSDVQKSIKAAAKQKKESIRKRKMIKVKQVAKQLNATTNNATAETAENTKQPRKCDAPSKNSKKKGTRKPPKGKYNKHTKPTQELLSNRQESNSTFCSDLEIPLNGVSFENEQIAGDSDGSVVISPLNESGDPRFAETAWPPNVDVEESSEEKNEELVLEPTRNTS